MTGFVVESKVCLPDGSGTGTVIEAIVLVGYALTGSTSDADGVITLGGTS